MLLLRCMTIAWIMDHRGSPSVAHISNAHTKKAAIMVAWRLVAILTTIAWSEECEYNLMHAKSVVLDKRKLLMKSILHSHLWSADSADPSMHAKQVLPILTHINVVLLHSTTTVCSIKYMVCSIPLIQRLKCPTSSFSFGMCNEYTHVLKITF